MKLLQHRMWLAVALLMAPAAAQADESAGKVSFTNDIMPILKANCAGCHKQGKDKGDLILTDYASLLKGGKHGDTVIAGKPDDSELFLSIIGDPPDMPEEGDPLKPDQIETIKLWIAQGAIDDTPSEDEIQIATPVYHVPPVITSMQYSPDGQQLAVAGYHEVLIHKADGSELVHRLIGRAPRVESLAFSPDGKFLAVAGGAPSQFGHVQIWNPASGELLKRYKISYDSLFGISVSPDGKKVAFGGADKVVRELDLESGEVEMEFKAHADWVFGTTYNLDGSRLVSAGRDQAMKLIDAETAQFIDDINNPLDKIVGFARHPKEDIVVYGGHLGGVRMYNISDNQKRTAGRNDTNLIRAFEQQPDAAHAVAISPDGKILAVGTEGEVRLYNIEDGKRLHVLSGFEGPVYALSWKPDGSAVAAAGFDGIVRVINPADGAVVSKFTPVPISAE